jgi:hypothetical protein
VETSPHRALQRYRKSNASQARWRPLWLVMVSVDSCMDTLLPGWAGQVQGDSAWRIPRGALPVTG